MSRLWNGLGILGLGLGLAVTPQAHSQNNDNPFDGTYIVEVSGHAESSAKIFIKGDFAFILMGENLGAIFAVETVGTNLHFAPLIQAAREQVKEDGKKEVTGNMIALGERKFKPGISGEISGNTITLAGTGLIRADFKDRKRTPEGEDVFPPSLRFKGERDADYDWRDVWEKSYAFDNVDGGLTVLKPDARHPSDDTGSLRTCANTPPLRLQRLFGGMAILRQAVGNLTSGTGEDIEKHIEGVLVNTYYSGNGSLLFDPSRYYLYNVHLTVNRVGWFKVDQLLQD